jgi:DNA (cytosine-5)-methyltransferase 1
VPTQTFASDNVDEEERKMGRKNRLLRHASLFSGIGGFDLAAEWMGWENVFHCEINDFCQQLLKHYYPGSESYGNIKKTDFRKHRGKIDVLTGGFPCQPFSVAGKRLGKEDERHLWPDMLRAIREIKPTWIVGENVLGITSWNGGMVFEEVQSDLEAEGYEVQPYVLPAAGVGAPHRRDRVWFVAYAQRHNDLPKKRGVHGKAQEMAGKLGTEDCPSGMPGRTDQYDGQRNEPQQYDATNPNGHQRSKGRCNKVRPQKAERLAGQYDPWDFRDPWKNFPTQPPICNGDDGLSLQLDGITFPKWRNQSIMAGGNAIVPQVAYQIFQAIQLTNNEYSV